MYWDKRKGEKCRVSYPLLNFTSHAIKRRCHSGFGPTADLDPPTGDEWGMKKRPKYEWSAGKQF